MAWGVELGTWSMGHGAWRTEDGKWNFENKMGRKGEGENGRGSDPTKYTVGISVL